MSPKELKTRPVSLYLALAKALFVFMQTNALLSPILLSLLLILLLSLAVNPVISRIRGFTVGRRIATGFVAAALMVVMALTGWALFVPMKDSLTTLAEQLPGYWERLQKPLIKMERQGARSEGKLQAEATSEIARAAPKTATPGAAPTVKEPASPQAAKESVTLRSSLGRTFQGVVGGFTSVAFNATQIMMVLVTVFFGVIFTLTNPRPIFRSVFSLVPERHHDQALTIVQRIGDFVPGWAGATLLGMLTIGMLVFLLMWPLFGLMDALVLGLIAGVLEAVPYLGSLLSAVPGTLLALGKGVMTPLWVVIAYLAIQALENNLTFRSSWRAA